MDKQTKNYLLQLLPHQEAWVQELEDQAEAEKIPIMDPLAIQFLMQLIRLMKPANILEIGTAIGYSALRMLEANPDSKIVTIEKDEKRYESALENIKKYAAADKIHVVFGDALEILPRLDETFDFVFIDAAKGQYRNFFNMACRLMKNNGCIVTDNILFRGYVADPFFEHARYEKMVEKIRNYNDWLQHHPDFVTSFIPIGDGVAISLKKEGKETGFRA